MRTFNELFEYFTHKVIPDIIKAITEIITLNQANVIFRDLSLDQKNKIRKGHVKYKGIKMRLNDLFSDDSDAYNTLTPEHIKQILEMKVLNFDNLYVEYLDKQVELNWENLPNVLREKVLSSKFEFQNENISYELLHQNVPNAFKYLSNNQLNAILEEDILLIGNKIKIESEFYVERKFIKALHVFNEFEIRKEMGKVFETIHESDIISYYLQNLTNEKSVSGDKLNKGALNPGDPLDNMGPRDPTELSKSIRKNGDSSNDLSMPSGVSTSDFETTKGFSNGPIKSIGDIRDPNSSFSDPSGFSSNPYGFNDGSGSSSVFSSGFSGAINDIGVSLNHLSGSQNDAGIPSDPESSKDFSNDPINPSASSYEINDSPNDPNYLDSSFTDPNSFSDNPNETTDETLTEFDLGVKLGEDNFLVYQKLKVSKLVTKTINETRLLKLIGIAGNGKSATFQQLSVNVKSEYPSKWVSYVELKDFVKFYNTMCTLEELLFKVLQIDTSDLFTKAVFKELFDSGQVVLFWNGFDEISPTYSRFLKKVFTTIHAESLNVQFICTRPLYSDHLNDLFDSVWYGFAPFTKQEQKDFLENFFIFRKVAEKDLEGLTQKVLEVAVDRYYQTPLMLKMIAEVHDDLKLLIVGNFYKIYEIFVEKKIEFWMEKSDFGKILLRSILTTGKRFNMMEIYQKYALLTIFPSFITKSLKIMKTKIPKELPLHEISRMAILHINSEYEFEFSHRTFAEFFVTQYLIENFYLLQDGSEFDEKILNFIYFLKDQKVIASFLSNFLNSLDYDSAKPEPFSPQIVSQISQKHNKLFIDMMWAKGQMKVFEILFKFFSKDRNLLLKLLQVHEDETLYTAIFNPCYFAKEINPADVSELTRKYLTDEEFEKFLTGRNQKGKILFGLAWFKVCYNLEKVKFRSINPNWEFLWNSFENFKQHLNKSEQRELLVHLLGDNLDMYTANDKFLEYKVLWTQAKKILSSNDVKISIGLGLKKINKFSHGHIQNALPFLKFLLNNLSNYSNCEIFQIFNDQKLLFRAAKYSSVFTEFWTFFISHSDKDKQKQILMLEDSYGMISSSLDDGDSYFDRDLTPFNLFHFSLFNKLKFGSFKIVNDVYQKYFINSKIREMIFKSNIFVAYMIRYSDVEICSEFFKFAEVIFGENLESLLDFLRKEDASTGYTVTTHLLGVKENFEKQLKWFEDYVRALELKVTS